MSSEKKLRVVIDAKLYTSNLGQETILKTYDDVKLRDDKNFDSIGLIICSENTILSDWIMLESTFEGKIHLIKINTGEDKECIKKCFYQEPNLDHVLSEYLTD